MRCSVERTILAVFWIPPLLLVPRKGLVQHIACFWIGNIFITTESKLNQQRCSLQLVIVLAAQGRVVCANYLLNAFARQEQWDD